MVELNWLREINPSSSLAHLGDLDFVAIASWAIPAI